MTVLCASCDREPASSEVAGATCAGCGAPLISVITAKDPVIGKLIDNRFEVVSRIGAGAMGTVYCAIQRSIGREVALKLIDPRYAQDVAAVKRFFREAQVASRLAHPNTVGVIEFGQDGDGTLYLVMELVRGRTLHEVLEQDGALPVSRLARIGIQLCDALEAAHAIAIVHRDLKLENVMLLDGGRDLVKVLDFGLARALGDSALHQTTIGLVSGSPRYMAPELGLAAAPPVPTHDLYSLGVCLAELAIGGPLWAAPTLEGLFAAKLDTTPTLALVPAVLRPLVGQLLHPEAERRPTAAEARSALAALETPTTIPPPIVSPILSPILSPRARPSNAPLATEPTMMLGLDLDPTVQEARTVEEPDHEELARGLARLELVAIDGSVPEPPPAPVASAHLPPADPAGPVRLELDPAWVARRASQQKLPYTPPPQAPLPQRESGSAAWLLIALLVIAAGGGAIHYFNRATPKPAPTLSP